MDEFTLGTSVVLCMAGRSIRMEETLQVFVSPLYLIDKTHFEPLMVVPSEKLLQVPQRRVCFSGTVGNERD